MVFSSASLGFGFTVGTFADMYSVKLGVSTTHHSTLTTHHSLFTVHCSLSVAGMKAGALRQCLWGDFYYSPKTKKVSKRPVGRDPMPMGVTMMLATVWQVQQG